MFVRRGFRPSVRPSVRPFVCLCVVRRSVSPIRCRKISARAFRPALSSLPPHGHRPPMPACTSCAPVVNRQACVRSPDARTTVDASNNSFRSNRVRWFLPCNRSLAPDHSHHHRPSPSRSPMARSTDPPTPFPALTQQQQSASRSRSEICCWFYLGHTQLLLLRQPGARSGTHGEGEFDALKAAPPLPMRLVAPVSAERAVRAGTRGATQTDKAEGDVAQRRRAETGRTQSSQR